MRDPMLDAPSGYSFIRLVAETPFFRLIAIDKGGRGFACRRLTARGLGDPIALARVHAEAQILTQLAGRGTPKLEVVGQDDRGPFTIYEWIRGTLFAKYTNHKSAPRQLALVAKACFNSLISIHSAVDLRGALGIVHGDIRPENIILHGDDSTPRATFVDFALARSRDHAPQTDGAFAGTIQYAAPEAARGEPSGQAEDVFALAMCILHAISQTAPRASVSLAALLSEAAEVAPALPKDSPHRALVDAIRPCFSMDPRDRPSALSAASAIEAALQMC